MLKVSNSTLSGNVASTFGGGIYIYLSVGIYGSVTVSGCTISGNSATTGGGIYNPGAANKLTVSNSIFVGNYLYHIFGLYTNGGGNTFS